MENFVIEFVIFLEELDLLKIKDKKNPEMNTSV